MAEKEHFNYQGCFAKTKLATLKNLINFGLSDSLKEAFPDFNIYLIDQRTHSSDNFRDIPHGMWVAGYISDIVSGDGSFFTKLTQSIEDRKIHFIQDVFLK